GTHAALRLLLCLALVLALVLVLALALLCFVLVCLALLRFGSCPAFFLLEAAAALFPERRYSASATALLCSASLAANSKVTRSRRTKARNGSSASRLASSSWKYLRLNSLHFAGSCANHLRSSVEGAISRIH